MKRITFVSTVCAVLWLFLPAWAQVVQQQVQQQEQRAENIKPAPDLPSKDSKLVEQEHQFARQMLEVSESEGRGFEAPMRCYTLLQVAQVYQQSDQEKARELLKDAFTASLGIQDDDQTKARLQEDIFRSLLPLSQADVEEALPRAELPVRKRTAGAIVNRYVEKKQFDPALDLVRDVARWDEFPYGSGTSILLTMPPEMTAEKQALFAEAVNSYKNHEHKGFSMGDDSLTNMLVRFGPRMPAKLVMEAIDEILSQAKKSDEKAVITLGGKTGSASFNSLYDYQLFALLPLVRQFDESRAKRLLEENQALQNKLQQYPQGLQSIDPGLKDTPGDHGMQTSVSTGNSAQGGPDYMAQEAMRKAAQIVEDSEKDPQQAIAQAASLPVSIANGRVAPRANALEGIARRNLKNNPSAAKQAISELRKVVADLPLQKQAQFLGSAADAYLQMGDTDAAEKVVSEGLKVADKILEKDNNADDPNKALKAWWPSTDAYRRFVQVETRISRRSAAKLVREIKDPEIRTVESIMVSRTLLGLPLKRVTIMEKTKHGNSMMMMDDN